MSIGDWLDERVGHRRVLSAALDREVRGGASFAYVWGGALALTFVTMAVTGVLLMTSYQPSATTAWSSVMYIQTKMSMGWLIRGLHHMGAHVMVVLLVLHVLRTTVFAAYRKPHELTWLLGLLMLILMLTFVRTGYLLPFDQEGYWATLIPLNILGTMPLGGGVLTRLAGSQSGLGHVSLTRFYTLHVAILPLAMTVLLALHAMLTRRHGLTPSARADLSKSDRYYPKQVALIMVTSLVVLGVMLALVLEDHGVPLTAPADAASDYPARPEWYFRGPFHAIKLMPQGMEWLVLFGLPLLFGGYLAALPFIDKKGSSRGRRIFLLSPFALVLVVIVGLTALSYRDDMTSDSFHAARELADKRAARALELAADGVPPAGPLAMLAADPQTRGPELFDKHCAVCHKLNDHGPEPGKETAPDLTGFGTARWAAAVMVDPDADSLFGKTAFKEMMPSMTKPPKDPEAAEYFTAMNKADLDAVAEFLAAEARGEKTKGHAGEKLTKDRCTSCHRLDGKTDDDTSLAPELRGWGSLAWIEAQIANPGSGKTYPPGVMDEELKGHMPAYQDQLSPLEVEMLAQWLYEQARGEPGD